MSGGAWGEHRKKKEKGKRRLQRLEGDLSVSIEIIINAISYRFGHGHPLPSSNHNPRIVSAATTGSCACSRKRRPENQRTIKNQTQIKFSSLPSQHHPPPPTSPPPKAKHPSHTPHFAPLVVNSFHTPARFVLIKLRPHRSFPPNEPSRRCPG